MTTSLPKNLRRIFSLVPLICEKQGITLKELTTKTGFSDKQGTQQALGQLMLFGKAPFSPSDFITIHIDDEEKVWLDFPLGLERPLALSVAEWTTAQRILRNELEFVGQGSVSNESIQNLLGKLSKVPVAFEIDDSTRLQRNIIQEAIADSLQIEFYYRSLSAKEPELRRVEPWLLFKSYGSNYIIAWCHTRQDARCFLLERMQDSELLEAEQEHPIPDDLSPYLKESPLFQKEAKGFSAVIAFGPELRANLKTLLHIKDDSITPNKAKHLSKNWLQATCKIQNRFWFLALLRSLGTQAVLLSPHHLRDSYRQELEEMEVPAEF